VLPALGPMRRQSRLKAGANEVAGALRTARSLAIARSAACHVYSSTAADPEEVRLYFAWSASPEASARLAEGVSIVSAPAGLGAYFGPDGSPSSAFEIVVGDAGGERYRISVSPGSGQVGIARVKP